MGNIGVIKNNLIVRGLPVILISFIWLNLLSSEVNSQTVSICPNQFVLIGKKCYYFSTEELSWQDAHFKCLSINKSRLAVVTKPSQESRIRNHLNKRPDIYGKYQRWLGGKFDWKQRRWVWAISGKPLEFQAFSRMDNNGGNWSWHCIITDPELQNKWSARHCYETKRYICQTTSKGLKKEIWRNFNKSKCYDVNKTAKYTKLCIKYFNQGQSSRHEPSAIVQLPSHNKKRRKNAYTDFICSPHMILVGRRCYYFSTDKLSWSDAYWACNDNKTKLAIINNQLQDNILRGFLNKKFVAKKERWIGGIYDYKQKIWKWAISGEPLKYQNFASNKSINLDEWYYITMDPEYDHKWNFGKHSDRNHYICQSKAKTVVKYGKFYKYKPNATIIIKTNNSLNNYKYSRIRRTTPTPSFIGNNNT